VRKPKFWSTFLLVLLSGCASLGRYPGQSDVGCLRQQMAPPPNLTFTAAASVCMRMAGGQPLTGAGTTVLPFNLRGAPDLQVQARAAGYTYTD
jgi:hypothetical protein